MPVTRSLLLAILCTAQVGHAALAGPHVSQTRPDASPVIEVQARKGTRLYTPDGAVPTAPYTSQGQAQDGEAALEQCMNTWDAGTHITKSKWREICQRQLKDRDAMYR
jgi:hypothetical protein